MPAEQTVRIVNEVGTTRIIIKKLTEPAIAVNRIVIGLNRIAIGMLANRDRVKVPQKREVRKAAPVLSVSSAVIA